MVADYGNDWSLDPSAPITPQIYRILRERIVHNDLIPGNRISESEIARAYDVSRQPVREAFIKLAEEGLISIRPQRGTIVNKIVYAAVMDARFLREAIEADIVKLLTETPDPALITELRAQLAVQREIAHLDPLRFIQVDEQFHRTLAQGAGKGGAWKLVEGLKSQMDRVRFLSLGQFPTDKLIVQHTEIADAIENGDRAKAEKAIRSHLREVLQDLPEVVHSNPDFFDAPEDLGLPKTTIST
ncbi:GntR family transcriptional regulator [Qingshengfaniella alkalisoli]|uniref:GntR family transcriptional regulator n=1 Tax=Qingshengfaniella alkalisoli TaxID=2599296 RepID=A0A5B8IBC7_9RHOB|nr:GntR family transcriptional regulator [Qingshengfaniella alkalisoli]QDY70726.1 GntR family transcriptional regulator [Qingshengfaniella alkalisoli]